MAIQQDASNNTLSFLAAWRRGDVYCSGPLFVQQRIDDRQLAAFVRVPFAAAFADYRRRLFTGRFSAGRRQRLVLQRGIVGIVGRGGGTRRRGCRNGCAVGRQRIVGGVVPVGFE